uniref:CUB domain-containing protein n=1 Tax=Panagrolaimus sp. ES5 TaxID=591445 RepID=A0AC34F055_9BILA
MLFIILIFLAAFNIQKSAQTVIECSQSNIPNFTIDNFATLQSPNFPQTLNNTPCNVHIKATNPNNYLWISMLNGAAPVLEILNDRGIVINYPVVFNSVYDDSTTVSYFDGSVFNLNYQNHIEGSYDRFVIFVSAVTKSNTFTSNGCQPPLVDMNNQSTTFTNIDYINGYPAYQRCENVITIPSNHQASISLQQNEYDADSDFVTLTYGNNTIIKWDGSLTPEIYTLTSAANGAKFAFNSDGNTNGAGYKAVFHTYECTCGPSSFVAKCNSTTRITPLNNNWYFCDNMACTYTLTSDCPGAYFHLYPTTDGLRDSDNIILKDNGKIVENITSKSVFGDINNHYLSTNSYNLEFHSGVKSDVVTNQHSKRWYIDVEPVYPKFTAITLDETLTNYVFWLADLKNHDVISVCSSTGQLQMFITSTYSENELDFYKLFDDKGLNNYIGSLKTALPTSYNHVPRNLKSTSGCFALYLPDDNYHLGLNHTILFKTVDQTTNNCENDVSVFQAADSHSISYTISINSTSSGSCKSTILSHITASYAQNYLPYIWIQNIDTASNSKIAFTSTSNTKALFELNSDDASQWQNFGLYTTAINVIVPPSSKIVIQFAQRNSDVNQMQSSSIQKGLIASPSFTGLMQTFDVLTLYQASMANFFHVNFQVKNIYGNPDAILHTSGTNYT